MTTFHFTFNDGARTIPVSLEAPDLDTATMRAGMRRAELLDLERRLFPSLFHRAVWSRTLVKET